MAVVVAVIIIKLQLVTMVLKELEAHRLSLFVNNYLPAFREMEKVKVMNIVTKNVIKPVRYVRLWQ
jgi:hypothetical protein